MDPIDILRVLFGLLGLYFGGDWLVEGSSRIAKSFGVSALIIGLTIVALGTSAPELLVSVTGAMQGESDLALGNVIGSNIANIGLILGLTGLFATIFVDQQLVKREIPIMIGVTLFATLLIFDGELNRLDGLILLFGFIVFNVLFYYIADSQHDKHVEEQNAHPEEKAKNDEEAINIPMEVGRVIVGVILLVIGANLMVDGAVNIATAFNVPKLVIGITMVAFGTSLPELATSITAALKGETDIAVGNVIGSNVANLLLVLGATAFVEPINVGENILSVVEFPIMIAFSIMLYPFARNQVLSRRESALFLGAYLAFVLYSFVGK